MTYLKTIPLALYSPTSESIFTYTLSSPLRILYVSIRSPRFCLNSQVSVASVSVASLDRPTLPSWSRAPDTQQMASMGMGKERHELQWVMSEWKHASIASCAEKDEGKVEAEQRAVVWEGSSRIGTLQRWKVPESQRQPRSRKSHKHETANPVIKVQTKDKTTLFADVRCQSQKQDNLTQVCKLIEV